MTIYENIDSSGFGTLFHNHISEERYHSLTDEEQKEALRNEIILSDQDLSTVDIQDDGYEKKGVKFINTKGLLTADVSLNEEEYLFIPLPYDEGWTVTVNGKEEMINRADIGFMAVKLNKGHSFIEMSYHQPLHKEGLYMTSAGLALLILDVILKRKSAN